MVVAQLFAHAELRAVQDSLYKFGNSFSAEQRIPSSKGYAHCLKSSSISNSYYKIFFLPNHELSSRLGIIASKRLMRRAIDRNTNKRVIRELFRKHNIKLKGLDLVVMVRRKEKRVLSQQLFELTSLFDKLEARCA